MAYKIGPTVHHSTTCEGVTYKLFRKIYGRRIELDTKLAEYNQQQRALLSQRAQLLEDARAKAAEILGTGKSESVLQIGGPDAATASRTNPEDTAQFQSELLRHLDQAKTYQLGDAIESNRLRELRPIYMDVYLHSVTGIEDEDDTPIEYRANMSQADKKRFYEKAPAELIDEIFAQLSEAISMTEIERANFGLPITGGAAEIGTTPGTTATSASAENSGDLASAASPK